MDVCSLLMALLFEFEECNTLLLWNFDLLLLLRFELLMCISGYDMVRGTTNANAVTVDDLKFDDKCIILLLQQCDATRRRNNMHKKKKIDEF